MRSLNGICYYSFLLLFRFGNRKAVEISHLLSPPHSLHFQKGNGLWPSLNQTLPYNRARYATNIESSPAIFHLHRLSIQINNSFNPHLDMFTANLLTSKSFFVLFLVLYHSFIQFLFHFFFFLSILSRAKGQRITTIQLEGVQYFVSRMNPYSPELNYFLAYQYCRSLGLQLASFETKEKVESMSQYLQNAGYSKYDFWTSGNRLGTGMFLWMSTGLPFNATFDYFDNANDAVKAGLLDPVDHNSNTAPQRTARDR